jgi:putative ABC transport system permease protein
MLNNYLKVGIRNIIRHKVFSFINVSGLAIAMSVCLLVIQLLVDQYSYDRFHPKMDRVYRILSNRPYSDMPVASTPPSLATTLSDGYAAVESATSLITGVGGDAVANSKSIEMRGFFGDQNFFTVFGFGLDAGDKHTALSSPNTIVISRRVAKALFRDEDALGKTVQFFDRGLHYLKRGKDTPPVNWGSFTITGVFNDDKKKSHLKFDVVMSTATRTLLIADHKIGDGDGL